LMFDSISRICADALKSANLMSQIIVRHLLPVCSSRNSVL
jgi:hypothetical protein